MTNEQLNQVIAVTVVSGIGLIVGAATVSFIEQIRKDRASRRAYDAITETSERAKELFMNEKFDQIIRENDL